MAADLDDLTASLSTRRLGCAHEHHATLGSTNDRAWAWASEGAPDGALVTTDTQTKGRGRMGRTWDSGGTPDLAFSLIVRPPPLPTLPSGLGALALAVAVGVREGLAAATRGHVMPRLKWPNDVLIAGAKVAGILCESRLLGDRAEVIIGVGINVGRCEFPPELSGIATSLALCLGPDAPPRRAVLVDVLTALEPALDAFMSRGFGGIRARYEPHCDTLGARVRVGDAVAGEGTPALASGLDHDGALLVRDRSGAPVRRVDSADVWLA